MSNVDANKSSPRRKTADTEQKENEEIIKIPSSFNLAKTDEPGPITKSTLISLMIVLFSVFLDFMGISLVQPILPFYAEMFNASSTELGALYSSYSGMSLIASLFMGKFSDMFGRKPMICFSLFGTCVGFLFTGLAQNYGQLLAFRFLTGIFGATAPVAMAVITDVVPSLERPKWLAAVGAVITIAFIIGPGLGAGLAQFGIRIPFFVSSGLGAFGFIFALILVKESHPAVLKKKALKKAKKFDNALKSASPDEQEMQTMKSHDSDRDNGYNEIDNIKIIEREFEGNRSHIGNNGNKRSSKIPIQVWIIYLVNMLTTLGFTVYTSMFALYMIDVYGLNTLSVGYITLVLATVITFANIIFVQMSKVWGMYIQLIIACFWCGSALLMAPFIHNLWGLLAVVVFGFGGGFGQIMPAMNATVATFTTCKNRGLVMGLSSGANNVSLIIGPMIMGILYGIDKRYIFFAGALGILLGGFVVIIMIYKWPELRYAEKEEEIDLTVDDIINWKYRADKVKRKDYVRLGKALGVMLSNKRYLWVTHFDKVIEFLDTVFPPMHPNSLEIRKQDIHLLIDSVKQTRKQFDSLRYTAHGVVKF